MQLSRVFFLIWSIDFIETAIFSLPFAVIAILYNFSWVLRSPQEKWKTLWLYKILGYFGEFWLVLGDISFWGYSEIWI